MSKELAASQFRLEKAIDTCDQAGNDALVYGEIARALRTVPSPRSALLFRRLAAKSSGPHQAENLRAVLDVLSDDSGGTGLGAVLDLIGPAVNALPIEQGTSLLKPLALAYAKAGRVDEARRHASVLDASVPHLSLLAHNPLISAEHKLGMVRFQVELGAITGRQGPEWTRTWLNRMARWLTRLGSESSRVRQLKRLLSVSGKVGEASAIVAGLDVADSIRAEDLRAEALASVLDASRFVSGAERAALRRRALEAATSLGDEGARARVWGGWLETASADEAESARTLGGSLEQIKSPLIRAEARGRYAGALARLGSADEAGQAWFLAAMADQEASTRPVVFASRLVLAARASSADAWKEVLRGVHCPDPEIAADFVAVGAEACDDAAKMVLLESEVRALRRDPVIRAHVSKMHLALARGWARLGDARRSVRLASLARKEGAGFEAVVGIASLLIHRREGRELLLRMIPQAYASGPTENDHFEKLAAVIAPVPHRDWAKEAFRQLYLAALERSTGSRWRDLEARAMVAKGIAESGQPRLAYALARAWSSQGGHGRRRPPPGGGRTVGSRLIGAFLPGLLLIIGLPAALGWMMWKGFLLARAGLFGPNGSMWLAGLLVAAVATVVVLDLVLRRDYRKFLLRVGMILLVIAVWPFLLGCLLFERYEKLRPSLRVANFWFRSRWTLSRDGPTPAWARTAPQAPEEYRALLRGVVGDSGPFDILFSALLLPARLADAASVSARLPDVHMPAEASEKLKKYRQDYQELQRTSARIYRFRKKIVDVSSKVGVWITGGFLAPLVLATVMARRRRGRRAHRAANRGDGLLKAGRHAQAAPWLRRATQLSPDTPQYWHDYACALAGAGKTDQAVNAHREATKKGVGSSDEPQFWYGLGFTLWQAGRNEEALEAFEFVLSIATRGSLEYDEARRGRGFCLANLGR